MIPFTFWTVLWVPPVPKTERDGVGNAYDVDDVLRFKAMLDRLEIEGMTFKCLSNVDIPGIETVPLACPDLTGWWAKMELYRAADPGRNVYCDLDNIVIRLDGIPEFPADFAICPNYRCRRLPGHCYEKDGRRVVIRYQASFLSWEGEIGNLIWRAFDHSREFWLKTYVSDQDFLGEQFPDLALFPRSWACKAQRAPLARGDLRVVLSTPHKNDGAARLYPWLAPHWHGRAA